MRLCRADLIFAPYWEDAHPDHLAATELTDAARFWAKLSKTDMAGDPFHPKRIYNYHSVHLKLAIRPAFILDISDYWEIKLAAVQAYGSQFDPIDTVVDRNFYDKLRTDAEHWGDLIGCRFGEPFSCREPLGISAIDALI
jgi:LmbE family N-acetylglucosaminyl deacetylase